MAELDPTQAFPVAVPDADTQPFWDACEQGELRIQRCSACQRWLWQPRPICSYCHAADPVWTRVSGRGVIASWTVMRPPSLPCFAESLPYVILLVELEEGARLLGYWVDEQGNRLQSDGAAEGVEIGKSVELRFHRQADQTLPSWTLANS